ncbi:Pyridoxal-phosphate binding site [Phytophthora cactorum]|nr:Pyridoxal-phosphate binding site [Phytophthora cactorum]
MPDSISTAAAFCSGLRHLARRRTLESTRPLDVQDPEAIRHPAAALTELLVRYHENLQRRDPHRGEPGNTSYSVRSKVKPGELRDQLPTGCPEDPQSYAEIFRDVEQLIFPALTHWASPNFHAYFKICGSDPSVLATICAHHWMSSASRGSLPQQPPSLSKWSVTGWLSCLDYPNVSSRVLLEGQRVSRHSVHSLQLVMQRWRDWKAQNERRKQPSSSCTCRIKHTQLRRRAAWCWIFRICEFAHNSGKADSDNYGLDLMMWLVPWGRSSERFGPFCLMPTLGTTSTTAIDPLRKLVAVAREQPERVWVHLDGAYGGAAAVCPEYQHWLDGVEGCDSICINTHKWLLVSFDASLLWVKDRGPLFERLPWTQSTSRTSSCNPPNYKDWQVPLGRRFPSTQALVYLPSFWSHWAPRHIRRSVALAKQAEELLMKDGRFKLFVRARMGLVCFYVALEVVSLTKPYSVQGISHSLGSGVYTSCVWRSVGSRWTLGTLKRGDCALEGAYGRVARTQSGRSSSAKTLRRQRRPFLLADTSRHLWLSFIMGRLVSWLFRTFEVILFFALITLPCFGHSLPIVIMVSVARAACRSPHFTTTNLNEGDVLRVCLYKMTDGVRIQRGEPQCRRPLPIELRAGNQNRSQVQSTKSLQQPRQESDTPELEDDEEVDKVKELRSEYRGHVGAVLQLRKIWSRLSELAKQCETHGSRFVSHCAAALLNLQQLIHIVCRQSEKIEASKELERTRTRRRGGHRRTTSHNGDEDDTEDEDEAAFPQLQGDMHETDRQEADKGSNIMMKNEAQTDEELDRATQTTADTENAAATVIARVYRRHAAIIQTNSEREREVEQQKIRVIAAVHIQRWAAHAYSRQRKQKTARRRWQRENDAATNIQKWIRMRWACFWRRRVEIERTMREAQQARHLQLQAEGEEKMRREAENEHRLVKEKEERQQLEQKAKQEEEQHRVLQQKLEDEQQKLRQLQLKAVKKNTSSLYTGKGQDADDPAAPSQAPSPGKTRRKVMKKEATLVQQQLGETLRDHDAKMDELQRMVARLQTVCVNRRPCWKTPRTN